MEYDILAIGFAAIGGYCVGRVAGIVWHLLTVSDQCGESCDCHHPDVGQSGECERCGANIEIGGSE